MRYRQTWEKELMHMIKLENLILQLINLSLIQGLILELCALTGQINMRKIGGIILKWNLQAVE